jgi:hypothetical protein
MYYNAHEFSLASQAWEYLVGLAGLVGFFLLWRFLNKPRKQQG